MMPSPDRDPKSAPLPRLYIVALGIITLGVWILAVIMSYKVFTSFGDPDWGDVFQPDKVAATLVAFGLIFGFFALPSLIVSALFAALLFWIIREFPQRGSQMAVLLCSLVYAGWPSIWAATTRQEVTQAYGVQILLVPILSLICLVAGRTAANNHLGRP